MHCYTNPCAALRFCGICQALALHRLSKCTINFTSLSPVSNSPTTLVPRLIHFGFGTLTLFDEFWPIRCSGDRMSALSDSLSQCPKMNTRPLLSFPLSLILHLVLHVMIAALPLFCALKWIEIIAITHKSISKGLILHKRPYYIIFILIISWIQRHIRGFSPFMINQKHLRVKALYLIPLNKCVQFHTD